MAKDPHARLRAATLATALCLLVPRLAMAQAAEQPAAEPAQEMTVTAKQEFGHTSYRELADTLKVLDQLGNNGHHLRLALKVMFQEGKTGPQPIEIWAVHDGREEAIESTPDGYFHLPYRPDWAAADAKLVSNQAKDTLRAHLALEVETEDGQPVPYVELRQGAKLLDRAIEEFVGPVMGFIVPGIDQFTFRCGPEDHCHVTASLDSGDALEADDKGQPILEFSRKLERRNPGLRLAVAADEGTTGPTHLYAVPVAHLF
ncbi:MAG: DUF2987 domain-containing protein [Azospirillaceae bacterium]|nr:DUF2987 domain-containing protein [Azospirillaceae bacterium]